MLHFFSFLASFADNAPIAAIIPEIQSGIFILQKYSEIEEQIGSEQELPPVTDLFKEMQDGFDNVAEDVH
jgi:hypothetical protein